MLIGLFFDRTPEKYSAGSLVFQSEGGHSTSEVMDAPLIDAQVLALGRVQSKFMVARCYQEKANLGGKMTREYCGGKWIGGEWVEPEMPAEPTEQEQLVAAAHDALTGEVPLEGEDNGWVLIGGIKFNSVVTIKSEEGVPLFDLILRIRPGTTLDCDPHAAYPILLKRSEDGGLERLSVNFAGTMDYSNQTPSPDRAAQLIEKFVQLGGMKPKPVPS